MILASTLLVSDSTTILPFLLFVGIIHAIAKHGSLKVTLLSSLTAFLIGNIILIILSIVTVYYSYGSIYAIYVIQISYIYVIMYTAVGVIGSSLGYYISLELE